MKIIVIGAGFVGGALVREFAARQHKVAVVTRHPVHHLPHGVAQARGSVLDPAFLDQVVRGADVVVSALPPLGDAEELSMGLTTLLGPVETRGARLGVVGGSSILPMVEGGPRQADTPGFPDWLVPRTDAHARALAVLNSAPGTVDWFYLIPAAEFGPHQPGTRTGSYRTSSVSQVTDDEGRSVLGVEDYAIAFADEIERPTTHRDWLAIGY